MLDSHTSIHTRLGAAVVPAESMELGEATFQTVIRGPALGPQVTTTFELNRLGTTGTLETQPQSARFLLRSPYVDVTAQVAMTPPAPAAIVAAVTQEAATAVARPRPSGSTVAIAMRGADLLPFLSPDLAARQGLGRTQPGAPPRLAR